MLCRHCSARDNTSVLPALFWSQLENSAIRAALKKINSIPTRPCTKLFTRESSEEQDLSPRLFFTGVLPCAKRESQNYPRVLAEPGYQRYHHPSCGGIWATADMGMQSVSLQRKTVMKEHKLMVRIISWDGSIQFSSLVLDYFSLVANAYLAEISEGYMYAIKLNALGLSSDADTTGVEWSISILFNSIAFQNRMAASNMLLGNGPWPTLTG